MQLWKTTLLISLDSVKINQKYSIKSDDKLQLADRMGDP